MRRRRALERLPTVSEVNSIRDVLPKDQEHKILLLKEMKPLLGDIRSIPAPSGPVDVDRLNQVFSRIRFKMIDSGSPEWGAARPLQAQMQEVRGLIDAHQDGFRRHRKTEAARPP